MNAAAPRQADPPPAPAATPPLRETLFSANAMAQCGACAEEAPAFCEWLIDREARRCG